MRVYNRAMGEQSWNTLEEYVETPTVRWYGTSAACGQDYEWLSGHWLSGCAPPPEGTMLYQDAFGLRVGGDIGTAAVPKRVPEYMEQNTEWPWQYILLGEQDQGSFQQQPQPTPPAPQPQPQPSPNPPPRRPDPGDVVLCLLCLAACFIEQPVRAGCLTGCLISPPCQRAVNPRQPRLLPCVVDTGGRPSIGCVISIGF